ncbi:hypothetical protein [Streptomyces sp. NPDC058371]|uniref:aromatic-ring hydroxylase C-terminal domain-containing protein n=1 Tax=Streptomyces sp. NPDC058371 TaxID=3346463 RepID=UPI00365C1A57
MADPESPADIERPEGGGIRQQIADAIPGQEEQYWSLGQQFGAVYESGAVITDGSPLVASTVSDYRPTAHPGAHAPHVWLESPTGGRVSTIDPPHTRFVVLAPAAGRAWVDAAREVAAAHGTEIGGFTIGAGGDYTDPGGSWAELYGLGDTGVVVVRPDGHVAFRAASLEADRSPGAVLDEVFGRLLGTAPRLSH